MLILIGILIGLVVGAVGCTLVLRMMATTRLGRARQLRHQLVEDAKRDAEALRREAEISAREDAVRLRAQIDDEISEHRTRIVKV